MDEADLVSFLDIKNSKDIKCFIEKADAHLEEIGYTEHGERHASIVAKLARTVLTDLKHPKREAEIAGIAGYLHDIGNFMGRTSHGVSGALLTFDILRTLGMKTAEIASIMGAIGNHEEDVGDPSDSVSAAVILADKADVHRSRVRNTKHLAFDIHDRVNYAAKKSSLVTDFAKKTIKLSIEIDTSISQVMEYFEIFLSRMVICRRAAKTLSCSFELWINDTKLW